MFATAANRQEAREEEQDASAGSCCSSSSRCSGLLAVVAATFAQVARNHMKLAAVASEGAKAEALADAGVNIVILDLVAARERQSPDRRFALDATPLACSIGGDGATLTHHRPGRGRQGRPQHRHPEPLLRALVLGLGLERREAAVDAILDSRDEDDDRRISGAERPEYLAAGRLHGPRNGPFLAVEELAQRARRQPGGRRPPAPLRDDPLGARRDRSGVAPEALVDILVRGLAGGGPSLARTADWGRATSPAMGERGARLPPQLLAASTRRAFSVRSEARTARGAMFVREAIVEFVATGPSGLQLAPLVPRLRGVCWAFRCGRGPAAVLAPMLVRRPTLGVATSTRTVSFRRLSPESNMPLASVVVVG